MKECGLRRPRFAGRWCRWLALALVFVLALGHSQPAAADLGGYRVLRFHVDLTVLPNADLEVEEHIITEFSEERHGIYRTIPVRYTDPRGFGYSIAFRLLEVRDPQHQRAWPTKLSSDGPHVRVRIGDPDRTIVGRQEFLLRYRVRGALRRFADHDELYWNAVGDAWPTAIENASVVVRLPQIIPPEKLMAAAWQGTFGTRQELDTVAVFDGRVEVSASRTLEPHEALTVAVGWPRDIVRFPGATERWLRLLFDNWIILTPVLALAAMYRQYRRSGRDPAAPAAVTVQYEPPPGLTPSEVGTLVDEKADLRDITAAIVDLAIRGYLRLSIEPQKRFLLPDQEVIRFERLKEPDSGLLPHEQALLEALFQSGDSVTSDDLREKFYRHLPGIQEALYHRLVQAGYFVRDPATTRARYVFLGIALGVLTALVGMGWSLLRGGILPPAAVLPVASGVLVALVTAAFAPAMPRRTESGVAIRHWALGFQEFVDRVESDRLSREAARQVFERLLPYAMALGVSAQWARKFEGIYEAEPPAWYVGPALPQQGVPTAHLERSLHASMAATAAAMAWTPRASGASGFGGGGFSGGGFGGGGGGSW